MKEITIDQWDKLSKKDKEEVTKISFPGTKKVEDVKHRPTMAFATMLKDEENCILKCLDAVKDYVDYVLVADNGSTDSTFDIVRKFFKDTGLPGAWHVDTWEGFGKTKTKMMAHVKDKTDYVIHLDADDFLEGELKFGFKDSGKDLYHIINKRGGSKYWCSVIYDNRLTWRFIGIAHTIIRANERLDYVSSAQIPEDMVWIDNAGTGVRVLDKEKFLKDAKNLESQYWETLINDPDGLNTRSCFYCAQSYKDQGRGAGYEKYLVTSLQWYNKYLLLRHSWFEEEYEACLEIASLKKRLNDLPELGHSFSVENIEADYLKAISIIEDRAEAYFWLGKLYNNNQQFHKSYDILTRGRKISLAEAQNKYKLFIMPMQYEKWFNDELSVACYYLGKKKEGIELINEVIDDPAHVWSIPHYQSNLDHFAKLEDE